MLTAAALAATPSNGARTSSLNWVRLPGAEECIGSVELAGAVEARLGRRVFVGASQAELAVEGRVEKAQPGFSAVLEMTDSTGAILGRRTVATRSPSCRELDGPLSFVLSVMIEPNTERAAPPLPTPPPPTPVPTPPPTVVAPAAPPSEPWKFSVAVGPTFTSGLTPNPDIGLALEVAVIPTSAFSIEVGGRILLQQSISLPEGASANISVDTGSAAFCPRWVLGARFELSACAGAEAGALRVVPVGFSTGQTDVRLLLDLTARARLAWVLAGRAFIALGAGGLVPLRRDTFGYSEPGAGNVTFFQPSAIGGQVDLAAGLRFP
jgi:hypothetical protein